MKLNKPVTGVFNSVFKAMPSEDGEETLFIEGYANTVSKDRAGDVIPAETWNKATALSNYRKNPIILAFHNHQMPIGKTVEVRVTELGLWIKAEISKAAGGVYQLIKDGVLSTFSVGFMIRDANYEPKSDTYYITDVELTEVSVVSVPCNQDSTFSVAKSLSSSEYSNLKTQILLDKGNNKMSQEFNLDDFKAAMAVTAGEAAAKALADQKAAERAELAKELAAKAEKEQQATAAKAAAKAAAQELVDELKKSLNEKDSVFSDVVKAHQDQIVALKDEIQQLTASRQNPVNLGVSKAISGKVDNKEVDTIVMLGMIKNVGMFDTTYGKNHLAATKAVNASSSIQVSSDGYETVFSTNLMRDIQARLVVAPLFTEVSMTSANLTIPINPDRKNAQWVDAGAFGTDASSGNEIEVALTERTLKTFKLAAKTYLTDETQEDAIIALIPLLRSHLVEAHANEIDRAFLRGNGSGQPKGLVTQAAAVAAGAAVQATAATANGSVLVTAKEILKARRKLGLYGINLGEVALVISQDAYWDLLLDDEWADVQQVSTAATKLVGEVGNIYGMPVLVSNQFAAKAAGASFGVMVNKTNFVVARQRGATIRSDFDVEKDRRVIVATQRLYLEPSIEVTAGSGNGKGVVSLTYAA